MSYRSHRPYRRSRKRRWLLVVLSLVVVITAAVLLVSRQTEQRGSVEFLAAADEASDLHSQVSEELESALSSVGLIERPELVSRFEGLVEKAAAADQLLELEAPVRISGSYGTMTTASSAWREGVSGLVSTIREIMDGNLVEGAPNELQASLDMLRAGDSAYVLFMESLIDVPEDVEVPVFQTISYIDTASVDPLLYDAQTLVLKIQTSYDLSPHHDIAVTAVTSPEPIGESGGIPVVPLSESLDVIAVISNEGNEDEASVGVTLEILNIDTGITLVSNQEVRGLLTGASTTVMFTELDIAPGGLYQITVVATIEGDTNDDNDRWMMNILWRAES